MATTYSKADLRNRALADIGVLEAGEAAQPEMVSFVDPICQQMLESLDDENILIFDVSLPVSTAVIPGRIMRALSNLLAWEISIPYGRPRGEREPLVNALRRQVLQGGDPIPVRTDYF